MKNLASSNIELNYEFGQQVDSALLRAEVDSLRISLEAGTEQLALERECAMSIHRARMIAITDSLAMTLVFESNDDEPATGTPTTDDILSSAFGRTVVGNELPEGMARVLRRGLKAAVHPDLGGEHTVASDVGKALLNLDTDPVFAVASALVATKTTRPKTVQELRDERYQLTLALGAIEPVFGSEEEARKHAEAEIKATEWRIRAEAGLMTIGLLLGSGEDWNSFLMSIVKQRRMSLVTMVNRIQPELLSLQERIVKGDPFELDRSAIEAIDKTLERIWSTLGNKKDSTLGYAPPYQNWLDIFMPVLRALDPGEKPGEQYTHFGKPIQVVAPTSVPTNRFSKKNLGDLSGTSKDFGYKETILGHYITKSYNEESDW